MFGFGVGGAYPDSTAKSNAKSIMSVNSLIRDWYPRTMQQVFFWATELWTHHGMYSGAIKKAVRYFMTDIEIYAGEDGDDFNRDTKESYAKILKDDFDILNELPYLADDFIAWGNSFSSLIPKIRRHLVCPHCGASHDYIKMKEENSLDWNADKFQFTGKCLSHACGKKVREFKVRDTELPIDQYTPNIVRWPPQYMEIKHNPVTGKSSYLLDVSKYEEVVKGIKEGYPSFLEDIPWEFTEAVRDKGKIAFSSDAIYHMRCKSSAYMHDNLKGWGLPMFMSEFEDALMLVLLDRYTENIMTDYLIPFRVIAPPTAKGGTADPMGLSVMQGMNAGSFAGDIKAMIDRHRVDPTGWNFVPYPLDYQVLGGEAKDILPADITAHYEQRLLNSMGIPTELYEASVNNSAGPIIGFKMFERSWGFLVAEMDGWLDWLTKQIGIMMQWNPARTRLIPSSIYEDPSIQQMKLDLFSAAQVSGKTAFKTLNLNYSEEQQQILDEELEKNERMTKQQLELEQQEAAKVAINIPSPAEKMLMEQQQAEMAGGAMPPAEGGGAISPQGSIVPTTSEAGSTIDSLMAEAQQLAEQLLTMPSSQRKSELINLSHNNPPLHAQTKALLQDLEQQGRQAGVEQMRQGGAPVQ